MSKRNLLNLILLAFIMTLVAVVVYEPGKEVAKKPTVLTTIKSDSINHITIRRHGAESSEQELEFKKLDTGWIMLKPYSVSANTFRINSILEILATVSFSQNNLEKLNLNTFGLDKPPVTLTFNQKTSLVFGHNRSLKNHRYIQIDKTLHLTMDTFYYQLAAKAESYINHKLLDEKSDIIKLSLPSLELEKIDSQWQATPAAEDFSADTVNQLINEWQLSQAYDVNKVETTANKKPDITLHLKDGKNIYFIIEKNTDSFNLINIKTGIRYILSADRKNKLLKLSSIHQEE